jgi:hypothetical protein
MFSQLTIEKMGYYVYCLINPEDNSIFYIGKGSGNRVFAHAEGSLKSDLESDKFEVIKSIMDKNLEVQHYILRYGLTEKEAFEVEAALIDFIGLDNLTNKVKGHYTERGKISCEELDTLLSAEKIDIVDNVLIIKINKLYKRGMTPEEIYEATRKSWCLSKKNAESIDYVLSVCSGIVREVFKPTYWYTVKGESGKDRLAFEGKVADQNARNRYLYKSIEEYIRKGNANPIQYIFGKSESEYDSQNTIDFNEIEKVIDDLEEEANIYEKSLLIKINNSYREGMSKQELYKATSFCWRLSLEKATKVKYVFAIYFGEIIEVYKPESWYKVTDSDRIAFNGDVAENSIRSKYIGKSVRQYYKPGESNPCKYINI